MIPSKWDHHLGDILLMLRRHRGIVIRSLRLLRLTILPLKCNNPGEPTRVRLFESSRVANAPFPDICTEGP